MDIRVANQVQPQVFQPRNGVESPSSFAPEDTVVKSSTRLETKEQRFCGSNTKFTKRIYSQETTTSEVDINQLQGGQVISYVPSKIIPKSEHVELANGLQIEFNVNPPGVSEAQTVILRKPDGSEITRFEGQAEYIIKGEYRGQDNPAVRIRRGEVEEIVGQNYNRIELYNAQYPHGYTQISDGSKETSAPVRFNQGAGCIPASFSEDGSAWIIQDGASTAVAKLPIPLSWLEKGYKFE